MGDYAARRGSARLPITAAVSIRFPGVDEEFEGVIGNIGMSGMLVTGTAPMPAGTLMHFEFRPTPQWHTLRGRGRIVWSRQEPSSSGEPAGMGVRFIELDERGRRGVRWLIETFQAVGDKPFDTWSAPAQFTRGANDAPTDGDVLATQEIVPVPPDDPEPAARRRPRWPLLAAGLALVVLFAGWAILGGGGKTHDSAAERSAATEPVEPVLEETAKVDASPATGSESADGTDVSAALTTEAAAAPDTDADSNTDSATPPPATEIAAAETADAPGSPASSPDRPTVSAVLSDLVDEWAAAWSSQDVDRYLAFYAQDFQPESGQSRRAWAGQRGDRLAGPEFIRVRVDDVQVLDQGGDMPRTVFTQSYESNTFADQVTKSLTWTRSEGTWRIIAERSAP